MSHIITTIGRGLIPVQVEYDITDDDDQGISVELVSVDLYGATKDKAIRTHIDVSGLLTDSVYASLEHDCKAHEVAERIRLADGDGYAKRHTLSHYMQQLAAIGGV